MVRPFEPTPGNTSHQFENEENTEEDEQEEQFTVVEIKDFKIENGKILYLVEWAGYPSEDQWTWIPPENFNGTLLIDEFHMRQEIENERQKVETERQQLEEEKKTTGAKAASFACCFCMG